MGEQTAKIRQNFLKSEKIPHGKRAKIGRAANAQRNKKGRGGAADGKILQNGIEFFVKRIKNSLQKQ